MSTLREAMKRMLPQRVRDGVRYVTDARYRNSMRHSRATQQHRAQVEALVQQSAGALWNVTGGKVASGPFQRMTYIRESVGSQWAPKLLGTYELELAPVIEEIASRAPALIVDIGAAEGYYAVGLAVRLRSAKVVAFEAEEASHPLLKKLAALNSVLDRIQILGLCDPASLNKSLANSARSLVVCDVEGAELALINPASSPVLGHADVLVEVHPWGHEQMAHVLRQRFENTHTIREIDARPRTIGDLPHAARPLLTDAAALACLDETRPCPMSWLWMTAS